MIEEELKEKLAKLGILYSAALLPYPATDLTQKEFIELCDELFDKKSKTIVGLEANKTAYSLTLKPELEAQLSKDMTRAQLAMVEKIGSLYIVEENDVENSQDNRTVYSPGITSEDQMYHFLDDLKKNQEIVDNPEFLNPQEQYEIDMFHLHVLKKHHGETQIRNWQNFNIRIEDEVQLNRLIYTVPPEEFWFFIKYCSVSINDQNPNFLEHYIYNLLVDKNYGTYLAQNDPLQFFKIIMQLKDPFNFVAIFRSDSGKIFAERNIGLFCDVIAKVEELDETRKQNEQFTIPIHRRVYRNAVTEILQSDSGQALAIKISKNLLKY